MAMSRTTWAPVGRGTARTRGLLPRVGVEAPQAGRLGRVLVKQQAKSPDSAACHP